MKLIIAGSRTLSPSVDEIDRAFDWPDDKRAILLANIDEVVSGMAGGVDRAGERWALHHAIPITRFPADWRKHGRAAGPIRNREVAEYADAALVLWDGSSRGAANMADEMRRLGKPVRVVTTRKAER